jgi:hypothetical protein
LLLRVFQLIVSPEQKEIQTYIKDHGGTDKVRNSDKALSQIIKRASRFSDSEDEISISTTAVDSATQAEDDDDETSLNHKTSGARKVLTVESLRLELADSFENSLTRNMEVFQGKFDVQKREIDIEIRKAMSRESQSIVKAIEEGFGRGPHVKVKDPDMRTLWENMASIPLVTFRIHNAPTNISTRGGKAALNQSISSMQSAITTSRRWRHTSINL